MLPRRLRLPRARFQVSDGVSRRSSPHFSVSYGTYPAHKNGGAAVVSKEVARRSVDRHRLRRRIMAVIRPWCAPQTLLIVRARRGAAALSFSALQEELLPLLASIPSKIR